jgi:anti-anti-sigma factor
MTVVLGPCSESFCTIYVEGSLRVPVSRELRRRVRTLLRRGARGIVVDLDGVTRIDAAGVGELVRAYNMTSAAAGFLRIVHATTWVRETLSRVGLFELLDADGAADYAP